MPVTTAWYTWSIITVVTATIIFLGVFKYQKALEIAVKPLSVIAILATITFVLAVFILPLPSTFTTINYPQNNKKSLGAKASSKLVFPNGKVLSVSTEEEKEQVEKIASLIGASVIGLTIFAELAPTLATIVFDSLKSSNSRVSPEVTYNFSDKMKIGEKGFIQVEVSAETATKMLGKNIPLKDTAEPRGIEMSLVAAPDEFKVLQIRDGKQYVFPGDTVQWEWEVTPLKVGNNLIVLKADIEYQISELEKTFPREFTIFEKRVLITSNWYDLIKQALIINWKDSFTLAGSFWIFSWWTKRMSKDQNSKIEQTFNAPVYGVIGNNEGTQNIFATAQNLAEAAEQIQQLLSQLQSKGMSTDDAQKEVANSMTVQAQNDPAMKDKLIKWGQSLGDATVSDVVKGVVKLAIRSAGIPLP